MGTGDWVWGLGLWLVRPFLYQPGGWLSTAQLKIRKCEAEKPGNNNALCVRMWQGCRRAASFCHTARLNGGNPGRLAAWLPNCPALSTVLAWPKAALSTNSALRTTRRQATSDDDAKGARPKPQSPSKNYVNFHKPFSIFPFEQRRHSKNCVCLCVCQWVWCCCCV